jgi:hypothetical protein
MLTREERFYETAAKEIAETKLEQSTWGKAFSVALGDEQRAKALYIKLRVDQLERYYQQLIGDLLRDSRAEITRGRTFVCPYCENRTTAQRVDVDFLVQLFTGVPPVQYFCRSCRVELRVSGTPVKTSSTESPAAEKSNYGAAVSLVSGTSVKTTSAESEAAEKSNYGAAVLGVSGTPVKTSSTESGAAEKSNNGAALTGFILGLASIVLYFVGIIPVLAMVFGSIGLATFKPDAQKNKWMAGVGLALGVVYTATMLILYGHMK